MHTLGHLLSQAKQIQSLATERHKPGVQLRDFAHLADQHHQPGARFLGFVDHLPLAVGHRRFCFALQHPQISADHAGGSPKLMDGERQQPRARIDRRIVWGRHIG